MPVPKLALNDFSALASVAFSASSDSLNSVAKFFKSIFAPSPQRRQRETLAQRRARVSQIQVSPARLVAYQGDVIQFSALPTDSSGETVQGATYSWASSDLRKLQIDDTGEATALNPGLVEVTCQAGSGIGTARLLIRPGERPVQTDEEWDADQTDSSLTGFNDSESDSPTGPSIAAALFEKLAPTALAQNNGGGCTAGSDNTDFGYDELWSEPRNLIGSPRNRALEPTRIGAVQPQGSNFNMAVPLYGLGGRGIGTSLVLYYNSRVWSRHSNAVTFNPVNGWPSAGFSLGFGRIFTYGPSSATKYVWVSPDGTRHYLGTGNGTTTTTYETSDGSHITFVGSLNGGSLYFNDGTRVSISKKNNRLLPTKIRDSNGNYILITYKTYDPFGVPNQFHWRQAIQYVTDTFGRVLTFNYNECGNLNSITVPKFGSGTHEIVKFDYQNITISNSFSGLTVENRPSGSVPALKHVYFPATDTGYKFLYSAYGMVYNVSMRKDMTIDVNGVISDGNENASVSFNYPTTASSLTDAPAFTERTETAASSPTSVYSYATSTGSGTKTFTITRPDGSKLLLTRSTATGTANGLLIESEVKTSGSVSMAKSVITYANDGGGSPQVETVTSYDDAGVATKIALDYDSYGNVTNTREYGHQISGNWQVRRRSHLVYKTDQAYLNVYLRSLVTEQHLYDALENTNDGDDVMISKATYTYDNYSAMGGMEDYSGQTMPPGHESSFNASYTVRGNVTGVTVYKDLQASQTITHLRKIDIFGNVVKEDLSCCDERTYMCEEGNAYGAPREVTNGTGATALTTEMMDDYNTGAVEETKDPRGLETTYTYDEEAMRPDVVTVPSGATQDTDYNDSARTITSKITYNEGGSNKTVTALTKYDGWGRVIEASRSGSGKVNTTYDSMGRTASRSNPFSSGGSPQYWTSYQYDALGRATVTTLPDGNTIQTSYNGDEITVTDQVSRKIRRTSDGLGRLVKVTEQDATGSLAQETTYSYDLEDQLVEVNQGGQLRKFKYDDIGRLLYERIPEQSATIDDGTGTYWSTKFTYTDFNAVATSTDARGVITTYGYDSQNRLTTISYNVSGATGVAATSTVTYNYSTATATKGLLSSVTVGSSYSESYSYDSFNRASSMTRNISGKNYATSYQYTTGGQVTQLSYPSGRAVNIGHDSSGRLSSVVNNADSNSYVSGVSYNSIGQMTGWTLGGIPPPGGNGSGSPGVEESFGYDAQRMQMTSQTVTQNSQTRMSLSYSYQATSGQMGAGSTAGNAGQLMSISGQINSQTESASYTYDNVGRLVTSSQTTGGASAQRRFAYDRWGNRTGVWDATSGGNQIQSITLEQSGGAPTNRMTSVNNGGAVDSYSYDAAGNVTSDGTNNYQYDAENRIVSVNSGSTATYSYDHQNRRVQSVSGGVTTHYVWEGSSVIAEHNGSTGAVLVEYIFAGGRMIAREDGGGRKYLLSDRLSIRATITDGQGSIQATQGHLPYGEAMGGSADKHRFTSYERESSTGLDYAVNRWHSPGVGRFLQADPYRASGGARFPQSWNRYSYVRNDAVNKIDPMGLFEGRPEPDVVGETRISNAADLGGQIVIEDDSPSENEGESSGSVGERVPLSGERLAKYLSERNNIVAILRNPDSACASFLLRQLGLSGSRVARAVLGQRAYDGTLSTINTVAAGIQPSKGLFSDMTVKEFFEALSPTAAQAFYADPSDAGATIKDVYYAPNGILAEVILHETLHYFLGITDTDLAARLQIDPSQIRDYGTQAISWKLRDEGCRSGG